MADNLNTVYLSTPAAGAINQTSADSTVFSDISVSGSVDAYNVDVGNNLNVTGAADITSTLSVDGATKATTIAGTTFTGTKFSATSVAAPFSAYTSGVDTDMANLDLRLVFLASGLSLCYSSGTTLYVVNSAQSEAQPTS